MREWKLATSVAEKAGHCLRALFEKEVRFKLKARRNFVTEADEKAQNLIVRAIQREFPGDSILAEEGPFSRTAEAPRRWIIDPLDGTTNFKMGYPHFCVSIAFEENNQLQVGVIYDPLRKELFSAKRGDRAFCNRKPLRLRSDSLSKALLGTGFPYDLKNKGVDHLGQFLDFFDRSLGIRRSGSAALDLAFVAAGRLSGFWQFGLEKWDVAAAALLIRQAGGQVLSLDSPSSKERAEIPINLVAGSPKLARSLRNRIRKFSEQGGKGTLQPPASIVDRRST
ncbi:MAG: inositol monophosphatase [Bradymonadales bacterium]|nr:MAG: inositol monophosphatase [Bradymonadales bacterium]